MGGPKKTILLTGATGFIGRRLAALLAGEYAVRCLVRDTARAREVLPSGAELVAGDMTDPASLRAALEGTQAVVHLAALKSDEPKIASVNVGGARNLAAACEAAGVRRVINVGSQASRLPRRGAYGDTKAEADAVLAGSGLEITTLQPSVVYGPRDPGVFGKLARVAASAPFVPVIGDGRTRYRPVHVDDVCAVIEGCLREPKTIGRTCAVGGPDEVTFDGLVDLIGAGLGRKPRKIHVPGWAALLIARVLGLICASPPLSRSNVLGALHGAPDADFTGIFAELGLAAPRPFAEGLRDALGRPS